MAEPVQVAVSAEAVKVAGWFPEVVMAEVIQTQLVEVFEAVAVVEAVVVWQAEALQPVVFLVLVVFPAVVVEGQVLQLP